MKKIIMLMFALCASAACHAVNKYTFRNDSQETVTVNGWDVPTFKAAMAANPGVKAIDIVPQSNFKFDLLPGRSHTVIQTYCLVYLVSQYKSSKTGALIQQSEWWPPQRLSGLCGIHNLTVIHDPSARREYSVKLDKKIYPVNLDK